MTSLWNEHDLIHATNGHFLSSSTIEGTGVSIDTRTLQEGNIFIAIMANNDGHDYVKKALQAGAACAIISHPITGLEEDNRLLFVEDTLQALTNMGRFARDRFKGNVIAITGSVGKTTTKEMLKIALSPFGNVHAAVGSYNNHLGVPLTLARMPLDTTYCICEIGMNHSGEIAPLADIVKPNLAVITEVASSHLGLMGNMDAIALEKSQIISALPKNSQAILPEDIYGLSFFQKMASHYHVQLCTVGTSNLATITINTIELDAQHSSFQIKIKDKTYPITLSVPGKHLVRNAALVISVVEALQLDITKAATALQDFQTSTGRGKTIPLSQQKGILLDESYNASTLSIRSALATLNILAQKRRIAVLGDILELGDYSRQEHLSLLPDLSKNADIVFCCGSIMYDVFEQLPPLLKGHWSATAQELIPFIKQDLKDGDTVLVKGSNSMRMNLIVNALTTPAEGKN